MRNVTTNKLLALMVALSLSPICYGAGFNAAKITEYRASMGVPADEQEMSVDELIAALKNRTLPWAQPALFLRCQLSDDAGRADIFKKLAQLAIEGASLPAGEQNMAAVDALQILGQQKEYRDSAVPAVLSVLDSTENVSVRDNCYRALGELGGEQAVRVLKAAILEGPAQDPRLQNLYLQLFEYLSSCGPTAAPVLLEGIEDVSGKKKYAMYRALGLTGDDAAAGYLLKEARVAKASDNATELALALRALFESATNYSDEARKKIADAMAANLDHPHVNVRHAAVTGLGKVGSASDVARLKAIAEADPYSAKEFPVDEKGKRTERIIYPVRKTAADSLATLQERLEQEKKM